MTPTRRGLITGFASLLAAPAIVRASSIMPVKAFSETVVPWHGVNWIETTVRNVTMIAELDSPGQPLIPWALSSDGHKHYVTRCEGVDVRLGNTIMIPREHADVRVIPEGVAKHIMGKAQLDAHLAT